VKIGVVVPVADGDGRGPGVPSWSEMHGFATKAEALGFDSVWVPDHLLPHLDAVGGLAAIHEAWSLVSALAASTSRVEIGTLVMATPFRNPALLAKMAVTADEVSGGRLILGLGTGYFEPEFAAFGYPSAKDRPVARFEEALHVIVPLLRGETVTFEGRFSEVRDAILLPSPGRHIPILIAARRPRMLRLTARWADAWNTAWFSSPDKRFAARLAEFDEALEAEGRDPASIMRTVGMEVTDEPIDAVVESLAGFEARGIDHVIVRLEPPRTERSLQHLGDAVAAYRATASATAAIR
jgi:alkanesulfonate monooxygenase SsuD/methylene tetrahydromethanopterin reductase-like flavin-dependent oxidoreductase (luciferase family)